MAKNEKTVFGATIERPSPAAQIVGLADTPPKNRDDTSGLPSGVSATEPSDPFDNFYKNLESQKTQTSMKAPTMVYVHDLESQRELDLSRSQTSKSYSSRKHDSMWPSMKSLKAKAKMDKRAKTRNPMRKLSKRTKWIASGLLAFLVIGAAVGIGVGVSRAVGGGVNNMNGGSRPIAGANNDKKQRSS